MKNKLIKIIQDNHEKRASLIQQKELNVFFIEKEQLDNKKINFDSLRKQLKDKLSLMGCEFLQVIGDSNPFSKTGHQYAVQLLQLLMKQNPSILLYGFTSNEHGGANGVVGEYIAQNPQQINKVFANIVFPQSIQAIQEWNCTYSEAVQNYLVVFDAVKNCNFGDDIELSDNLAEKLLCLEGGVISFCQVVNTLIYHKNPVITLVEGLRDGKPWFSAAELIGKLRSARCMDDLNRIKEDYLRDIKLYDPSSKAPPVEVIQQKTEQVNIAFDRLLKSEAILKKLQEVLYIQMPKVTEPSKEVIGLSKQAIFFQSPVEVTELKDSKLKLLSLT